MKSTANSERIKYSLHVACFLAAAIAYVVISLQCISAPFFPIDDHGEIYYVRSQPLAQLLCQDLFGFFRPVKNLIFLAFASLSQHGMAPARLLAVAIGLLSFAAVTALFRRIMKAPPAWALAASTIWLLSPTMVSCTAWLSAVNIQVMSGFCAVALLLYHRAGRRRGASYALHITAVVLCSFLALVSYEGAVSLAPVFVAMDFFLRPHLMRERRTWGAYTVLALTFSLYLWLRAMLLADNSSLNGNFCGSITDLQVAFSSAYFILFHTSLWFWPFGKQAFIGYYEWGQLSPAALTFCWGALIIGIAAIWHLRRRAKRVAFGATWLLLALLPMSNILAFRNGPYGDYYLAFASMGIAIMLVAALQQISARISSRRALLVLILIPVIWRTSTTIEAFRWSSAWNNTRTVYERNLATFPRSIAVILELAKYELEDKQLDSCLALLERAEAIDPKNAGPTAIRAFIAIQRGQIPEAERLARKVIEMDGAKTCWAWYFLGHLYSEEYGDSDSAIEFYNNAMEYQTLWTIDGIDAAQALALIYAYRGDEAKAIDLWEQVLELDPSRTNVRKNLAIAYKKQKQQPDPQS